ncbi:MAG: DUF4133 domain-containing protein [Bacteroides sp.]|uniref:DUF4133 domain-containing protein n=2 Tax=Bacteroides sp. TaxID=29523 RepID=UPI002FC8FC80
MAEYLVNKGVDKSIECLGFKSQYVIVICVGIVILFFSTTLLLALNISLLMILPFLALSAAALFYGSSWMNKHLGESGLTKIYARLSRHTLFSNRKLITSIIQTNKRWSTQEK